MVAIPRSLLAIPRNAMDTNCTMTWAPAKEDEQYRHFAHRRFSLLHLGWIIPLGLFLTFCVAVCCCGARYRQHLFFWRRKSDAKGEVVVEKVTTPAGAGVVVAGGAGGAATSTTIVEQTNGTTQVITPAGTETATVTTVPAGTTVTPAPGRANQAAH